MIDTRGLVARLSDEAAGLLKREVVAPLLPGGAIRVSLGGLVKLIQEGAALRFSFRGASSTATTGVLNRA